MSRSTLVKLPFAYTHGNLTFPGELDLAGESGGPCPSWHCSACLETRPGAGPSPTRGLRMFMQNVIRNAGMESSGMLAFQWEFLTPHSSGTVRRGTLALGSSLSSAVCSLGGFHTRGKAPLSRAPTPPEMTSQQYADAPTPHTVAGGERAGG